MNGSKDAQRVTTNDLIGLHNSETHNSNEIGDKNSSILSKGTNTKATSEENKISQNFNSDTNHAIRKEQTSLNQTESDVSNDNRSATANSNGMNLSTNDFSANHDEANVPTSHLPSTQIEQAIDNASTTIPEAENNKSLSAMQEPINMIPNHSNVMQEPMNNSLEPKLCSDDSISSENPVESNSAKANGNEDGNKKQAKQFIS